MDFFKEDSVKVTDKAKKLEQKAKEKEEKAKKGEKEEEDTSKKPGEMHDYKSLKPGEYQLHHVQELEIEKLKIEVFDYNFIGSNALVGEFELDVVAIYFSEQHSFLHKWIAISNVQKNFQDITGFVKFSANIVGQGEDQVILEDEKIAAGGHMPQNKKGAMGHLDVMLPPQIRTSSHALVIDLVKAEKLIKMDTFNTIDSFVVFEFASSKMITKTKKDTLNPEWHVTITLPYSTPSLSEWLTVKLYDWDMGSKDEIVGSSQFNLKDIQKGITKQYFWLNIYGAQLDGDEENSRVMNAHPELGTLWKGRLYLKIEAKKIEKPKLLMEPLIKIPPMLSEDNYEMYLEVYYGMGFRNPKSKYKIEIRWADISVTTNTKSPENGVWKFYQRIVKKSFKFPYKSMKTVPDIFVYLVEVDDSLIGGGEKRICYYRKSMKDIQSKKALPELLYLKPDKSKVKKMKQYEAGGQDLMPADDTGTSDPFVEFSYYGVKQRTDKIRDTLNPIWNRWIIKEIPIFNKGENPPIFINVFDYDPGAPDEFIGRAIVDVEEGKKEGYILVDKIAEPKPKWFDLEYDAGIECGRILLSFNIFTTDISNQIPKSDVNKITLPMKKYHAKIRILGLRDLKSLGLLPVKKPFIKFDLNSLKSKENKEDLEEKKYIYTQPNDAGSNPNICTIITFDLDLPEDLDFCPNLSCVVHDSILKGSIQPVLGSFSIDLLHYITKTTDNYKNKLKKFTNLLEGGGVKGGLFNVLGSAINEQITGKVREDKLEPGFLGSINEEIPLKTEDKYRGGEKLIEMTQNEEKDIKLDIEGEEEVEVIEIEDDEEEQEKERPKDVIDEEGVVHSEHIVLKARYAVNQIERTVDEVDIPDPNKFMPLGWDRKENRLKENVKKHYRYYVDNELELIENSPFLDKNTFDVIEIWRGKRVPEEGIFASLMKKNEGPKNVGIFKGWIEILSHDDKKLMQDSKAAKFIPGMKNKDLDNMERSESLSKKESRLESITSKDSARLESVTSLGTLGTVNPISKKNALDNEFLEKTHVLIRVYVLTLHNLHPEDVDSDSDPYIKVKLGKTEIDNRDDHLTDVVDCDMYRLFELSTVLPGASRLHIQVWDYDKIVPDDLIGETIIDLENRYFSKIWRKLEYVPIETRELMHPLSKVPYLR